jgi:hypothetical protein
MTMRADRVGTVIGKEGSNLRDISLASRCNVSVRVNAVSLVASLPLGTACDPLASFPWAATYDHSLVRCCCYNMQPLGSTLQLTSPCWHVRVVGVVGMTVSSLSIGRRDST